MYKQPAEKGFYLMNKDYLFSNKPCLDDSDFDLSDISLTFSKSQSHEVRFVSAEKRLKINENKRKQEITEDIQ